ncbi:MAG: carboxypeptidase-like regulatory domain-containing protein [Bacteroidia bacterium]|nr:carboxypeptidase-like regulatory domain-containing protein [Bacteroidia bacterium]
MIPPAASCSFIFKTNRYCRLALAAVVLALLAQAPHAVAQRLVTGIVVDSASLDALVNVHIIIKKNGTGTVSDSKGRFGIVVSPADTVVFSLVGYATIERTGLADDDIMIRMSQRATVLKEVSVEETPIKIDGIEPSAVNKFDKFQNNTSNPGPGEVATFGPGIKIPLGGRKDRKMKSKLEQGREENQKAMVYVQTINSPEVKDMLMKKYNLTEDDYYKHLQDLNVKYKTLVYELSAANLKNMIFNYFENNVKDKP